MRKTNYWDQLYFYNVGISLRSETVFLLEQVNLKRTSPIVSYKVMKNFEDSDISVVIKDDFWGTFWETLMNNFFYLIHWRPNLPETYHGEKVSLVMGPREIN